MRGREAFERAGAGPGALAELPVVRASAADGVGLEREGALGIVWDAHLTAAGRQLPDHAFTIRYPKRGPTRDRDFDDRGETARRLPGSAALHPA